MTTDNTGPIQLSPSIDDINAVLSNNPTASLQVQVQMLARTVSERDAKIAELESEIEALKEDMD